MKFNHTLIFVSILLIPAIQTLAQTTGYRRIDLAALNKSSEKVDISQLKDSIIIISNIMDCGEFGGHLEAIKMSKINGELHGIFSQDTNECSVQENPPLEVTNFISSNVLIDKTALSKFISYFNDINPRPPITTNAPSEYWIIINNTLYHKLDWRGNTWFYENLRNVNFMPSRKIKSVTLKIQERRERKQLRKMKVHENKYIRNLKKKKLSGVTQQL